MFESLDGKLSTDSVETRVLLAEFPITKEQNGYITFDFKKGMKLVFQKRSMFISDAGQPTSRQDAKAHTFAPLFGATGYGRTKAVAAYYEHFNDKYPGIAAWHKKLANEAMRFQKITNKSGRQYAFPDVTRRKNGGVTHFTMIKNYPVQGFATGDVVPVVLNRLHELLQPLQSCVVNSVHDSMVVDVHPDEKEKVLFIIETLNRDIVKMVEDTYDVHMNVPLLLEAKIGPNWLDTVDV